MTWPRCENPPTGTSEACISYATFVFGGAGEYRSYSCTHHVLKMMTKRPGVHFVRIPMEVPDGRRTADSGAQ